MLSMLQYDDYFYVDRVSKKSKCIRTIYRIGRNPQKFHGNVRANACIHHSVLVCRENRSEYEYIILGRSARDSKGRWSQIVFFEGFL